MDKLQEFLEKIDLYGKFLTIDAVDYVQKNIEKINIEKVAEELGKIDKVFIEKEDIIKIIESLISKDTEDVSFNKVMKTDQIIYDIDIISNPGIETDFGSTGSEYFLYFMDRYRKLRNALLKKLRRGDIDSIGSIKFEKKRVFTIIGIIYAKRISKKNVFIEIEDDTGRKTILISRYGNEELYNKTKEIPPDSVIGIKASQYKGDLLIAKEIYLPDVTVNKTSLEEDIYAVFTSDLHIGSNKFIEDAFLSLIDILKGYTDDEKLKNIIKKIRYFVIAGDLVDGVGVFPNQESELLISDIKEQYNYAYNILKKIPGYIKIIIIPGNHDATRKALPQPPIRKEYADKFYDDKQFLMLGNPVNINLHGVNCYLYHGDFLQDMFTLIPEITQNDLNRAMRILLQVRHIAPTYGATTRIAAEKSDKLIIPEKLNIFHTGHIHRISIGRYKDILMINSGTWQLQTAYQKANGFSPTPGIVPIINLKDRSVLALNLLE